MVSSQRLPSHGDRKKAVSPWTACQPCCEPHETGCRNICGRAACPVPQASNRPAWGGGVRHGCHCQEPAAKMTTSAYPELKHQFPFLHAASKGSSLGDEHFPILAEAHPGYAAALPLFSLPWPNGVLPFPAIGSAWKCPPLSPSLLCLPPCNLFLGSSPSADNRHFLLEHQGMGDIKLLSGAGVGAQM